MEDNTIWTDGAFPDEKNYGLSKMEYTAIRIFSSAISSRPELFEVQFGAQKKEEINDIADIVARKSWILAAKLAFHGEYVADKLREGVQL